MPLYRVWYNRSSAAYVDIDTSSESEARRIASSFDGEDFTLIDDTDWTYDSIETIEEDDIQEWLDDPEQEPDNDMPESYF